MKKIMVGKNKACYGEYQDSQEIPSLPSSHERVCTSLRYPVWPAVVESSLMAMTHFESFSIGHQKHPLLVRRYMRWLA
jgi:hypothetical protein